MRLVILESPYSGNVDLNVRYARACLRDCLSRGESPIASHLLLTQEGVLRDGVRHERMMGMEAGWAWYRVADACVVYTDLGVTEGMHGGMNRARAAGVVVEMRELPGWVG